jgi:hypothetical protein
MNLSLFFLICLGYCQNWNFDTNFLSTVPLHDCNGALDIYINIPQYQQGNPTLVGVCLSAEGDSRPFLGNITVGNATQPAGELYNGFYFHGTILPQGATQTIPGPTSTPTA